MKKIILILIPFLFMGCNNYKYTPVVQNGEKYKCVSLEKGLYRGEDGLLYHISFNVEGNDLQIYLVKGGR